MAVHDPNLPCDFGYINGKWTGYQCICNLLRAEYIKGWNDRKAYDNAQSN